MKTTNFIKLAIAGLSLAILSGCVNTRAIESNELNTNTGYVASPLSQVTNNIKVEVDNFKGTSSFGPSLKTMPALDNNEAKEALTSVLKNSGFYNADGDFTLKATMVDPDAGGISKYWRTVIINYKLTNNVMNQVVFDEDIVGKGETPNRAVLGVFGNTYEFAHQSGSLALEDNFKSLVNLLSLQ